MIWVWVIFSHFRDMKILMLCYPVSYIITIVITGAMLYFELKKYNVHLGIPAVKR